MVQVINESPDNSSVFSSKMTFRMLLLMSFAWSDCNLLPSIMHRRSLFARLPKLHDFEALLTPFSESFLHGHLHSFHCRHSPCLQQAWETLIYTAKQESETRWCYRCKGISNRDLYLSRAAGRSDGNLKGDVWKEGGKKRCYGIVLSEPSGIETRESSNTKL